MLPSKTVPDGGLVIHHQGAWTSERFVGAAGRGCRLEDVVARHPPGYAALDVRAHWVTTCALPYGACRALLPASVAAGPGRSDHRRPEVATAWMTSPRPQSIERIAAKTGTARTGHGAVTARSSSRRHRRPRHCRLPGAALATPGRPFVLLTERRPSARSDCPPRSPSNWAVVCLSGTTPTPLTTPAPGASPTAQPW
ncbi:hypothetical protein [Streptomyces sp. GZWMJZ-114]|uniref:hypothetical protein n=1 Tax=Streptomyces sp. GZWMJZ-114 TaxID=2494734 RepID=UPI0013E98E6B|nr:hypothetical protein [Streptomyces sp. GZWMJZ-114]